MTRRTVYFIKPVGMEGPIKIGCSQSPDGRRKTLSTWSPYALEIVAEIEGDDYIERRFHAAFKAHFQRREWFTGAPEIHEAIRAINAGTFDLSSLPDPERLTGRRNGKRKPMPLAHRYELSAKSRLRRTDVAWSKIYPRIHAIFGGNQWGAQKWYSNRHQIETLIASLGGKRSRRNWDGDAIPESAAA